MTGSSRLSLGAVLVVALSGCASGFTGSSVDDFGTFRIDVTNDLAPRAQIYLVAEGGDGGGDGGGGTAGASEGVLLGGAPVEGTTTFRIDLDDPTATLQLRAALTRGREVLSDPFVPTELSPDPTSIRWVLADNVLAPLQAPVEDIGTSDAGSYSAPAGVRRPTGARLIPPAP